jgi:hypothetical protein
LTNGTHRVTLEEGKKEIRWSDEKDALLLASRGIGFERIAEMIEALRYLALEAHWNPLRFPNQRVFVLDVDGYAYLVPFVESPGAIFLKTAIPSRKATRLYLRGR